MTRRKVYVAGIAAMLLVGSAVVAADAARSVPGDLTYGLKQAFVELRIATAPRGTERAQEYLENTDTKIAELERLLQRQASVDLIAEAAERVLRSDRNVQAELAGLRLQGVSEESLEKVKARAAASHRDRQRQLGPATARLQGPSRESVRRALESDPLGGVVSETDKALPPLLPGS
ncbi:MAG: DUF5667 domain-containing protein [Patescibacteria group bacterium]